MPLLSFNYSQWLLPVVKFGNERVLSMKFNSLNFTASGMITRELDNNKKFVFGVGIGLAVMKGKGVSINGKPELINSVIVDSSAFINRLAPYIALTGEYIFPISTKSPLYLGAGAQIQYTYFFAGDTKYRVDIVDNQLQYYQLEPELLGHMINPVLYATVYYRFGERR